MKQVYIFRQTTSDQGTAGLLATDGVTCKTLELPWRDNKKGLSCIPPGVYPVKVRKSPKFGLTYWVTNVQGREFILIHGGNYAGDVTKGWKSNVLGCIELGLRSGILGKQRAILNSRIAVRRFMKHMNNEEFRLTIIGGL